MKIGVLALQGAFARHCEMLKSIGVEASETRTADELNTVDALILPGGESTAISYLLKKNDLIEPLKNYSKPIFGTCAGLILMSNSVLNSSLAPLNMIDILVERNAYGRQLHSFKANLTIISQDDILCFQAFFIRAPKILKICSSKVEVLATHDNTPVFVKQGNRFAATFHPELTEDPKIHQFFVDYISKHE